MNYPYKDSSEFQLMLACCRYAIDPSQAEEIQQKLGQSIDEKKFLSVCREHRLELVAQHALSGFSDRICLENFFHKTRAITLRQFQLHKLVQEIHRILKQKKIIHTFLKGPVLNDILFGSNMLRYSRDLDILVPRENVMHVDSILRAKGFSCALSRRELRWHVLLNTKKDVPYQKTGFAFEIELHWKTDFLDEFCPSKYASWASKLASHIYYNDDISTFSHDFYALYLCFHASKHGWSRLIWLLDIVLFIQKKDIKLDMLLKLAKQLNLTRIVYEMLALSNVYFNVDYGFDLNEKTPVILGRCKQRYALLNTNIKPSKLNDIVQLWSGYYKMHANPLHWIKLNFHLSRLLSLNLTIKVFAKLFRTAAPKLKTNKS